MIGIKSVSIPVRMPILLPMQVLIKVFVKIRYVIMSIVMILSVSTYADTAKIDEKNTNGLIKVEGKELLQPNGDVFSIQGISFGNRVWTNDRLPYKHHDKDDYARVKALGMNTVRFYINYQTLEHDDKPYSYLDDGWQWLDKNIEWAKENNVYLILNIHVPQGGFQSNGDGWGLWTDHELQNRLVAMWKAIAQRYKNETTVLAYDLLNEPGVPKNKEQWQVLAQRLVNEVRKIDADHPLVIARVNNIAKRWDEDKDLNFIRVVGDNLIYTFHTYEPFFYTHQYIHWDKRMVNRDGGTWPDEKRGHNRARLDRTIKRFVDWGNRNSVPLYLGEWGLYKATFQNNHGGENYLIDMLAVIKKYKLHQTYHVYHEEAFGLYWGDDEIDPENKNRALEGILKKHLKTHNQD
ncbi:MAG: aryl-phospho-beta-D-glucosidase BglC (GH1 family) [Flavobacteriales bacterium]|jgi:aryl-phospho-beta-D-glucosidase BglC (GH1 family)